MIFTQIILILLMCYLPLTSTILLKAYANARYEPFDNQSIISNLSGIHSQDLCICRCRSIEMCLTVMHSGYYQYCILYKTQLDDGQLRIMTIQTNSSVISLRNKSHTTSPTTAAFQTTMVTTAMMTTAVVTCTTHVTFDDISGQSNTSGIIPNTYKNLNWTNAQYINTSSFSATGGYVIGARSRPFVMQNLPGTNITLVTANGTRFSFDGMYLTSVWRQSLSVIVKTIRAGVITSVGNFTLMTYYRKPIVCDFCTDVDTMTFESRGGIPNSTYPQNGTEFLVDDLCISFGR